MPRQPRLRVALAGQLWAALVGIQLLETPISGPLHREAITITITITMVAVGTTLMRLRKPSPSSLEVFPVSSQKSEATSVNTLMICSKLLLMEVDMDIMEEAMVAHTEVAMSGQEAITQLMVDGLQRAEIKEDGHLAALDRRVVEAIQVAGPLEVVTQVTGNLVDQVGQKESLADLDLILAGLMAVALNGTRKAMSSHQDGKQKKAQMVKKLLKIGQITMAK